MVEWRAEHMSAVGLGSYQWLLVWLGLTKGWWRSWSECPLAYGEREKKDVVVHASEPSSSHSSRKGSGDGQCEQ
eukprot:3205602-Amphidinium_carterae.1